MKKVMLILMMLVVCAGSLSADTPVDENAALRAELASTKAELHKIKYANTPPIEQQIKPAPVEWKEAYGDSRDTQIYFNIKTALFEIEQCKQAIRILAATITDITNPDDPNSLVSRIGVLEEKVADMPVFEVHPNPLDLTLLNTVDTNKALKPDDPKEVAK